jgi:hypothetical protein
MSSELEMLYDGYHSTVLDILPNATAILVLYRGFQLIRICSFIRVQYSFRISGFTGRRIADPGAGGMQNLLLLFFPVSISVSAI